MRITTVPLSLYKLLQGQMAYMHNNGFEVLMVSANGPEVDAVVAQEGCNHQVVNMTRSLTPFQDIYSLWKLFLLMRRFKPHVVHTHTPKAGLLGMLAARFAGVPVRMHTVAGLPWMETKGLKRSILKMAERLTAWAAQYVYVNSRSLRAFMVEESVVENVEKLIVLGAGTSNGINLNYFSKQAVNHASVQELKQSAGLRHEGKVWLFVGRLVLDKGIKELVQAFQKIVEQFPDDQLWLVGPAEDHKALPETLIHSIRNHAGIKMWGYQEDVRPFMMSAYSLVFPSYREGFPNVPLQAAAMECPLILSDINGCNELVTNNENGLLVPVKDYKTLIIAMIRMRNEEDMKLAFIKKTLQIVRVRYCQQQIHQSLKSEYLNALNAIKG